MVPGHLLMFQTQDRYCCVACFRTCEDLQDGACPLKRNGYCQVLRGNIYCNLCSVVLQGRRRSQPEEAPLPYVWTYILHGIPPPTQQKKLSRIGVALADIGLVYQLQLVIAIKSPL